MAEQLDGVGFPGPGRSSTAVGQRVLGAAAGAVDPGLAAAMAAEVDWYGSYTTHNRRLEEAVAAAPERAADVASAGLAALHGELVHVRDGVEAPLAAAADRTEGPGLASATLRGRTAPDDRARLPLGGRELTGDALHQQVDRWVALDALEPDAAAALHRVVDEPAWLDASDLTVVVLGGSSEMGPLEWLARWGAHLVVLDLPGERPWGRIVDLVDAGAGTALVPVPSPAGGRSDVVAHAGVDLLHDLPRALSWLDEHVDGPVTVGDYVYAHGATNVLVSAAADVVAQRLLAADPSSSFAVLGTPTDVYTAPPAAIAASRGAWSRRGPVRRALSVAGRGVAYAPNYVEGSTVVDCQVPQQGCNYALAKRLHRWRAEVARAAGHRVSANVAPATRTRSVTDRRVLAAAFGGAPRFGVEVFEPATSRALMALLLLHDLRAGGSSTAADPDVAASRRTDAEAPADLFAQQACHGGLWRIAHAPRTVLPVAAAQGLLRPSTWR